MRYLEIAERLRDEIAAGGHGPRGRLPSEAELGGRFSVSRVTVRRALEELRADGIVTSRRGSGWFVAVDPVRQALGRFSTVEAALEASGTEARRRVLEFAFEAVTPPVAETLGLEPGDDVLRVLRRVDAADEPFGLVTVWLPAARGAALSRDDVEAFTFYELLTRAGVELGAATQTISAGAAAAGDARELGVRTGSAMLLCRRVTADADGRPVIVSEHRYPAHRTEFEVEFPRVGPAADEPVGLRLVSPRRDSVGAGAA